MCSSNVLERRMSTFIYHHPSPSSRHCSSSCDVVSSHIPSTSEVHNHLHFTLNPLRRMSLIYLRPHPSSRHCSSSSDVVSSHVECPYPCRWWSRHPPLTPVTVYLMPALSSCRMPREGLYLSLALASLCNLKGVQLILSIYYKWECKWFWMIDTFSVTDG